MAGSARPLHHIKHQQTKKIVRTFQCKPEFDKNVKPSRLWKQPPTWYRCHLWRPWLPLIRAQIPSAAWDGQDRQFSHFKVKKQSLKNRSHKSSERPFHCCYKGGKNAHGPRSRRGFQKITCDNLLKSTFNTHALLLIILWFQQAQMS